MTREPVELPWPGRPHAIAPVAAALRHRLAGRRAVWTDGDDRGRCDLRFLARELARYAAFRALDLLARGCAALLPGPRADAAQESAPRDGPVVIVVAVLPDLSHTFIYREILALLAQRPSARVVCLARGRGAPVHPEARALTPHVLFAPRAGIARRYAALLGGMLRAPRRAARVLAAYGSDRGALFGKGALREPTHPGSGFVLADTLRALRPSHVHVYGSTYPANVALEAACLLDVPFSISSYVDFDFPYDHKLLRQKYTAARFFRVCTRFCRGRLRELLPESEDARVPVIVFGLDLERWRERAEPNGTPVLLSAARLVAKKGLHLVPPALARLRERGIECRWRVAGDGPERVGLQALVAHHELGSAVEFLGPLGNDEVRALLERTHLALLPCVVAADGERDGIPIFLTEAMAMGVPVLSTSVSGIPEVIRDGDTGFLCRPGDAEALADRLAAALADAPLRRAVGQRGRAEILATHDVTHSAAALWRAIDGAR
jgi:glycosyltransferase involved in cell wall biosynthesis